MFILNIPSDTPPQINPNSELICYVCYLILTRRECLKLSIRELFLNTW